MENSYCIDWLSFTIKIQNEKQLRENFIQDIFKNLLLDDLNLDFEEKIYGRYNYNSCYSFNNMINIYFNKVYNKSDVDYLVKQGVHIEFSGSGCRLIETTFKSWQQYFNLILKNYEVNFSRIDIAMDDFNKLLNFNTIEKKIKKGEIISKTKKRGIIGDINKIESLDNKGQQKSRTFYFGSRKSNLFIRFYDKKLEVLSKNKSCDFETWQRYEIVLKKEKALSFVDNFKNNGNLGEIYKSIINNLIKFVDPQGENKSRWPVSKFWVKFLDNAGSIELAAKKINTDIEKTVDWIDKSVVSSILFLNEILETENKNIFDVLQKSERDKKIKHSQSFQIFQKLEREQKEELIKKIENIAKNGHNSKVFEN